MLQAWLGEFTYLVNMVKKDNMQLTDQGKVPAFFFSGEDVISTTFGGTP